MLGTIFERQEREKGAEETTRRYLSCLESYVKIGKMKDRKKTAENTGNNPEKQVLVKKIVIFVAFFLLLSSILAWSILLRVGGLGEESNEQDNLTPPLKETVLDIKHHQLGQNLVLEKIFRISSEEGEEGEEYIRSKKIQENILVFENHGRQINENITNAKKMVESALAKSDTTSKEYWYVRDHLTSLEKEHNEFELLARELITNLIYNNPQESHGQFEVVEAKAGDVGLYMDQILLGLTSSTEKTSTDTEEKEDANIRMTGLLVVIEAAVAVMFGVFMVIFSSRHITLPSRKEADVDFPLEEKKVLLKEVYHRVKNNLQVISSLLYLQSEYTDNKESLDMFKESQNRVKSMALVHDKVYQSKDLARVDFPEYIQNLASYLFRTYNINRETITLTIDVDDVYLGPDIAIPCGLIINELMLNSLKHAFRVEKEGEIRIKFHVLDHNRFLLVFEDNGVDFSKQLDSENRQSLGLKLVSMLTRQLGGTMEFDGSNGNVFRIMFPRDESLNQGS